LNMRTKIITAVVLVVLMVAVNRVITNLFFGESVEINFTLLIGINLFSPVSVLLVLSGLLLGTWWGIAVGATYAVLYFSLTVLGLFSTTMGWGWFLLTGNLVHSIIIAGIAGLYTLRRENYLLMIPFSLGALFWGGLVHAFIHYINLSAYLPSLPQFLWIVLRSGWVGYIVQSLLATGVAYGIMRLFMRKEENLLEHS